MFKWLLGIDIPESPERGKDGSSVFIALATFALAQGGALTVVARGEDRDNIVLIIYGISVVFTTAWIVAMLRSKEVETIGSPPVDTKVQAYDSTSRRYGQFTLVWTVVLAAIMTFLALEQLLPNQTHRIAYLKDDIAVNPQLLRSASSDALSFLGATKDRSDLARWVQWLSDYEVEAELQAQTQGEPVYKRYVWIEQRSPFEDHYKDFACVIEHDAERFKIGDRIAFLIRRHPRTNVPTYRQLLFRRDGDAYSDILDVSTPSPDEVLVIVVETMAKDGDAVTDDVKQFKLALKKAK